PGMSQNRDNYYHAMVVDAFSSDAIPVHLITEESIAQYFKKLAPGGVLLVHTSNRHVNLVAPVSDVAKHLGLKWRVARDRGLGGAMNAIDETTAHLPPEQRKVVRVDWGSGARGHFQSEYIMLARDDKYLPPETPPEEAKAYKNL